VPDRVVKTRLSVQMQEYIAGMEAAAKATRATGTEAEKLAQKSADFDLLGRTALAAGGVMAAGIGLAVSKFAEFDQAMSYVQAATHETADNMGLLREASLEAGASTVFSATESANAIEELSKAGVETADILGGALKGSLDLAAAGGLGVARAAEISATALQQYNLDGTEAAHVSDVLAAGAGKAMGSVDDLAQGLKFVGPIAASMGVSLEETTAVLALFAQQGIIGEQAGTGLRGVLASLTAPSSLAAKEIQYLGLQLYDSQGNFLGLKNAAGELEGAYRGMSEEQRIASMGLIFGRESMTAATALYQAGSAGVADWTDKVNDSGYAAETAAMRLDNLAGDMEALSGAVDTAMIKMGEGANGPLRLLAQSATTAVDSFSGLPAGTQQAALGVGALAAAATLGVGAFFTVTPKVAEYRQSLDRLGPSAQRAGRLVGAASKTIGVTAGFAAAVVVLDQLAVASDRAGGSVASLEETTSALLRGSGGVTDLFKGLGSDVDSFADGLELLTGGSVNSNIERFGSTLNGIFFGGNLSDQVKTTKEQFAGMGEALAQLVQGGEAERAESLFDQLAVAAEKQGVPVEELMELLPAYADALAGVSNEQQLAAGTTEDNSVALAELAGGATVAGEEVQELSDIIRDFGSATMDSREAEREFQASIDDLTQSVQENGATLDVTTEAGRNNEAALDGIATSAKNAAAAILDAGGSQEDATGKINQGRDALKKALEQFDITGQAAEDYADDLGLIPGNVSTSVSLSGYDNVMAQLAGLRERVKSINQQAVNPKVGFGLGDGKAGGGAITGPGGPREDLVPIMASNGEHMLTAADVEAAGGHGAIYAWRQALHAAGSTGYVRPQRMDGYADGGAIVAGGSPVVTVNSAPVTVRFEAPIIADGNVLGWIRGVAGEVVRFEMGNAAGDLNAGYREG
jgi:TP901 family phage tail tape measure protein